MHGFWNVFTSSVSNLPFLILLFPVVNRQEMFEVPAGQGTCPGFRYRCRTPACHPSQETLAMLKNTFHIPPAVPQDSFTGEGGWGWSDSNSEVLLTLSMHFICTGCHRRERVLAWSQFCLPQIFSLFCFFLHIQSIKLLKYKIAKKKGDRAGFPSNMMDSTHIADIRGERQVYYLCITLLNISESPNFV